MSKLTRIITATDPLERNQSVEGACAGLSVEGLLEECAELDRFRRHSDNLYQRVRALFFLYALHRFHLPQALAAHSWAGRPGPGSFIPFKGYEHLLQDRKSVV